MRFVAVHLAFRIANNTDSTSSIVFDFFLQQQGGIHNLCLCRQEHSQAF